MLTQNAPEPTDAVTYQRIAAAIAFLRARRGERPDLAALAAHLGLSTSQTQRLFTRWAGISPKRFQQHLGVAAAKRRMRETGDLLGLALDAGLSGPGRLHDQFVTLEAMSPGEYRRAAAGVAIRYGIGPTPFGPALIATTRRGICRLAFIDPAAPQLLVDELAAQWPQARLERDDEAAAALLAQVFAGDPQRAARGLALWIAGSNFQVQVWRALLRVPFGGLVSYRQLAGLAGRAQAARAVGSAVAANPVAFLIPCHRVLRASGEFGDYRWGATRKAALCGWEAARCAATPVRRPGHARPGGAGTRG